MTKPKQCACEISVILLYVVLFFEMNSLVVFILDKNVEWVVIEDIVKFLFGFFGTLSVGGFIFIFVILLFKNARKQLRKKVICL